MRFDLQPWLLSHFPCICFVVVCISSLTVLAEFLYFILADNFHLNQNWLWVFFFILHLFTRHHPAETVESVLNYVFLLSDFIFLKIKTQFEETAYPNRNIWRNNISIFLWNQHSSCFYSLGLISDEPTQTAMKYVFIHRKKSIASVAREKQTHVR